jgi:hypothetical protein
MNVGISGHQDIPAQVRPDVRRRLTSTLVRLSPLVTGVTSLAAGADQLFADVVLEIGGQLHVVLPCAGYETTFERTAEVEHFRQILSRATRVEQLEFPAPSEDAFLAAGRRIVELSDEMIVAWDRQPAKGKGGTADIVRYASSLGKPVYNVWPEGAER